MGDSLLATTHGEILSIYSSHRLLQAKCRFSALAAAARHPPPQLGLAVYKVPGNNPFSDFCMVTNQRANSWCEAEMSRPTHLQNGTSMEAYTSRWRDLPNLRI